MSSELTETEARLHAYMEQAHGEATIANMYKVVKLNPDAVDEPRAMQMCVGAFVSKINKKIKTAQIIPGQTKRTYKLVPRA